MHALVHAINEKLGAVGKTVAYSAPVEAESVDRLESLKALAADMHAAKVKMLVVLGGNPLDGYWNFLTTKLTIVGGVIVSDQR